MPEKSMDYKELFEHMGKISCEIAEAMREYEKNAENPPDANSIEARIAKIDTLLKGASKNQLHRFGYWLQFMLYFQAPCLEGVSEYRLRLASDLDKVGRIKAMIEGASEDQMERFEEWLALMLNYNAPHVEKHCKDYISDRSNRICQMCDHYSGFCPPEEPPSTEETWAKMHGTDFPNENEIEEKQIYALKPHEMWVHGTQGFRVWRPHSGGVMVGP